MSRWFWLWFGVVIRIFRSRRNLLLENLALRQQLTVLKRKHPKPKLRMLDILFWVVTRRFWSGWKQSLIVVTPETVVRWHRAGFRLYWSFISKVRKQVGRNGLSKEVKDLIFGMVAENPCASPEFCPVIKSTVYTSSSIPPSAMTVAYVPLPLSLVRINCSLFSPAPGPAPGESGPPATTHGAEA